MFNIKNLTAGRASLRHDEVLTAVAAARGLEGASAQEFNHPSPPVPNGLASLPMFTRAADRLWATFQGGEPVTFFGDFDCDGLCSLAQMLDLARASGSRSHRVFIPDRAVDGYGVGRSAVDRCLKEHNPKLLFCVDCGTAAIDLVRELQGNGVDVVVVDHHDTSLPEGGHPAHAHLNPKDPACGGGAELASLSASGLVFLFCEAFAERHELRGERGWSRERSLVLGGFGALADVTPMVGLNRALVKNSLRLMNNTGGRLVPGLAALWKTTSFPKLNSYSYSFVFSPMLNAGGRVGTANDALRLLAAPSIEAAEKFVPKLDADNRERKAIQDRIIKESLDRATDLVAAAPGRRVLVLSDEAWHPGVVGIVAGRLREQFRRSAIVVGWNALSANFRGSGRGAPGVDLRALAERAVAEGVVLEAGGHPQAAGFTLSREQMPLFQAWLDRQTADCPLDTSATYEVLGDATAFSFTEWHDVVEALEPFGIANPRPHLLIERAKLVDVPAEITNRHEGAVFKIQGTFELPNRRRISACWRNLAAARGIWKKNGVYRLVSMISTRTTAHTGRTYEEWDVVACAKVAASDR